MRAVLQLLIPFFKLRLLQKVWTHVWSLVLWIKTLPFFPFSVSAIKWSLWCWSGRLFQGKLVCTVNCMFGQPVMIDRYFLTPRMRAVCSWFQLLTWGQVEIGYKWKPFPATELIFFCFAVQVSRKTLLSSWWIKPELKCTLENWTGFDPLNCQFY